LPARVWFDPIEAGLRRRVRGFIEALLEQEPILVLTPLLAAAGDLRPELPGGKNAFLKLNPSAWTNRQT